MSSVTVSLTTEENIRRGREAMEKVISEHTDVRDAMYREDVGGGISFLWGNSETKIVNGKKIGPNGIAHIIDKHGVDAARKMPEVLAKGTLSRKYAEKTKHKSVDILYDGYIAHLALYRYEDRQTWIVTGYKDEKTKTPDATGEGFDSSSATHSGPTHARPEVGAGGEASSPAVAPSATEEGREKAAVPRRPSDGATEGDAGLLQPQKDVDSIALDDSSVESR